MELENRIAIVTGAGQGIGKGLALRLAQEGCHLAAVDINLENSEKVVNEIKGLGRDGLAIKADITDSGQVANMVGEVVDKFGRIDILVNNAGVLKSHFIADFPEEDWDFVLAVNLKGAFLCIRETAKVLVEQRSGVIVNINSKSGKTGGLWNHAYCASKFGVIGLTQCVALDLAPYGVRINSICPGNVLSTPLWDLLDDQYAKKLDMTPEEVRQYYVDKVPLKRECKVEDVANLVVFLASEKSSYMTGQSVNVTGGQEVH